MLSKLRYAIVDIETTGGRASRDKITEIAVVVYEDGQIVDTFESLVNPECYIPYGITQLTGITQEMVEDAPKFYEIAKQIVEVTSGAIFVAHNVRFDYSFIKEEFSRLGYTFSRRQLCTVRLSRQVFPGLPSYSLENLIRYFNIKVEQRHRALADAKATTELLELILSQQNGTESLKKMVNLGIRESLLPQNLSLERLHDLPDVCGVYYFHDIQGQVVYVGKSINIQKRVAEHFADKTDKAGKLQQLVHDISYEHTGSELVALLLESEEIKRISPTVNRAQRQRNFPYLIHSYTNEGGYLCLNVAQVTAKARRQLQVVAEFPKLSHARGRLQHAMKVFELCGRFCNIQPGKGACFHYHLKQCRGACAGQESPESYNQRAIQAMDAMTTIFDRDFFILDRGRHTDEYAVVLVEGGAYCGFGYVDRDHADDVNALRDVVRYRAGNPETTRIIQRFVADNETVKIVWFEAAAG
ncbi:MAG: 3'-5' exoribonuclease [Saprospiraceae bacterium]|nr:3'-5' exoribonuclease [Saprospiraceae bacterium]